MFLIYLWVSDKAMKQIYEAEETSFTSSVQKPKPDFVNF